MVGKSSFGRGFNASILNSYVLSLLIFISLSILLIVLSAKDSQTIKSLKYNIISVTKPFFVLVATPLRKIDDSVNYIRRLTNANEINAKLLIENKLLNAELNKKNYLLIENHRLKNLLDVKDVNYVKKITARIIIDSYKDDNSLIYIDAGKREGLKINDIVFNEKGLLGRITELGTSSSKVLTIFDNNSVIPVTSVDSKKSFFVQGNNDRLLLKHIDKKFVPNAYLVI